MQRIMFVGLLSFSILSGVVVAHQSGEEQKGSSMQGMMEMMMKGEKGREGMSSMEGMMRMMKMMEQCSAMMESAHPKSREQKEGEKE